MELPVLNFRPHFIHRRLLRPSGNPNAKNLFDILHMLQKQAGVKLEVKVQPQF